MVTMRQVCMKYYVRKKAKSNRQPTIALTDPSVDLQVLGCVLAALYP